MIDEQRINRRCLFEELVNLTTMMLQIMELPDKNFEDLLIVLEQRQRVIDQLKQLPSNEIKEMSQDYCLNEELLRLNRTLREKMETRNQELRETITVFQQRKASMSLYKKRVVLAEGLFLDNKR